MRCEGEGEVLVFVEVGDPDGGWSQLRRLILGDSARGRPHLTLVHPRTSNRGAAACEALAGRAFDADMLVAEVALVAFDGRRWPVVETFALRG